MGNKLYYVISALAKPYYALVFRRHVIGAENIPKEGGFIMCSNHITALDPLFITSGILRRRMYFLAKKEIFEKKIFAKILTLLGGIPIDRGSADIGAVRTCLKTVGAGNGLFIFPQGTRSRDNTPTPMLGGTSLIAMRAGVPVIPAYIDGPFRLFKRVDLRIGTPVDLSDLGKRCDSTTLKEATGRIEKAIWGLRDIK